MIKCYVYDCSNLEDPLDVSSAMEGIPQWRQDTILKYKMQADRKRSLAAALFMIEVLPSYGASIKDVVVGDNGRLCLPPDASCNLDFNISHSGKYVIMAISDSKVGCDIELMKTYQEKVAKRYFSEGEQARIEHLLEEERMLGFYRVWTARESYTKMTGEGITLDFREYETCEIHGEVDVEMEFVTGECDVKSLGSVGVQRGQARFVVMQYKLDDYVISICAE